MGDPTSSYATAGIALRVSGALKPQRHDKVETPSVGNHAIRMQIFLTSCLEYLWEYMISPVGYLTEEKSVVFSGISGKVILVPIACHKLLSSKLLIKK
jgi:hypothetical protein